MLCLSQIHNIMAQLLANCTTRKYMISASTKDVHIGAVNNALANIWDIVFPHGIPVDVNCVYLFQPIYDYVILF